MSRKIASVLIALVGALYAAKGMHPDLSWVGFVEMFTPHVVLGLILVVLLIAWLLGALPG